MSTKEAFLTGILAVMLLTHVPFAEGSTVRIRGEIVAVDAMSTLAQMTNIPASQLYIVRVLNSEQTGGRKFVLVRHKDFDRDSEIADPIEPGMNIFVFKAKRSKDCDASLDSMDKIRLVGTPSLEDQLPRFTWLSHFSDLSNEEELPCYTFRGNAFRRIPAASKSDKGKKE